MDPDLPANLESLSNHVRQVIEDLGKVAAAFALNGDGGDEEFHVQQRDTAREGIERVAQRQTEILLLEDLLEFRPDRRRQLIGGHADRRLKRVPRADGPRHEVERLRELLLERLQPARSPLDEKQHRRGHAERHGRHQCQRISQQQLRGACGHNAAHDTRDRNGARRRPNAGLLDQPAQTRTGAGAADDAIDARQRSRRVLDDDALLGR